MTNAIIDFRARLPEELRPPQAPPPAGYRSQYDAVIGVSDNIDKTLADLIAEMEANGVEHTVVHAEYEYGDPADAMNQAVAKLVREDPARFSGFGTISMAPLDIMRALGQVAEIAEQGLIGVSIQPSFFHLAIDDARLYPVYAKAAEVGLMVALHTGINYSVSHPIKNDHPLQLDQVACDFPSSSSSPVTPAGPGPPRWWRWAASTPTCSWSSGAWRRSMSAPRARAGRSCTAS